ncbi:cupin [Pokkaliibacter plantistimulans]|uniref:Cupin n=1 Tax=Proteobacteria bacterium 228 TaxID=2083153 RepID=A0A2S5KGS0_9PROT|nr:cupin domain-containing protein [Pokkaliibacter plantistimulans]PPC73978.1 cupin [Pokkaliibacter plantistimulans]
MDSHYRAGNLFADVPTDLSNETFEDIVRYQGVVIERITSLGHRTSEDSWYDQPQHEWVMVVQGSARLLFEDGVELALQPGDYVNIPAHCKHRVSWTDPDQPTLWLAVHYPG